MSNSIDTGEFTIRPTDDGGIIVSGHGDNRAISPRELREMVTTDGNVIVA